MHDEGGETVEERLDDDGVDDERRAVVVPVWSCNLEIVDVFQLCPIDGIGTFGSITWQGIAPSEIRAACDLLLVERHRWPDISHDVHYMGIEVAQARTQRARHESARGG